MSDKLPFERENEEDGPEDGEKEEKQIEEDREPVYEILEQIHELSPSNREFLMKLLHEQDEEESEGRQGEAVQSVKEEIVEYLCDDICMYM